MRVQVRCQPAYAVAYLHLAGNEEVLAAPGSMVSMSTGVTASVSTAGGVVKAAARKVFGQEGFFLVKYKASVHGAWVAVGPTFPGDIAVIPVDGHPIRTEAGAFLAAEDSVELSVAYAGARPLLLREGATALEAAGTGNLVVCSYGAIEVVDLRPSETLIVDSGHLVAYYAGMRMRLGPFGSLVTAGFSGEGFVAEFTGPGRVWFQTRAEQGMRDWLLPGRAQNER